MHIHELLTGDTVATDLVASGVEDLIAQMVSLLSGNKAIADLEVLRKAVLDRERIMSTGVGKGIALPHAKTSSVNSTTAVFVTTKDPIDFGSFDNVAVRIVFMLVGNSESKSEHIRILSRISRLLNKDDFRDELLAAGSGGELLQVLKDEELLLMSTN